MRLINNDQIIISKIVHQCVRRLSRFESRSDAGNNFQCRNKIPSLSSFPGQNLSALLIRCASKSLSSLLKKVTCSLKFFLNILRCFQNPFHRNHIVRSRIQSDMIQLPFNLPGKYIHFCNSVHFVPKNSTRIATSDSYAGESYCTSPRTRNVPR